MEAEKITTQKWIYNVMYELTNMTIQLYIVCSLQQVHKENTKTFEANRYKIWKEGAIW